MKVDVYFNLHKKKLSVRCCSTRRVIAHVDQITLNDASFRVNERGRQRVLAQKRKNVHAYVRGEITQQSTMILSKHVVYNPFKYSSFVDMKTKLPVIVAKQVCIAGRTISCTEQ